MDNAHSFLILRLLYLAQKNVIQLMNVREQFHLSTVSRKSQICVKNCTHSHQYHLGFDIRRKGVIVSIADRTHRNSYHYQHADEEGFKKHCIAQAAGAFKNLELKFPAYLIGNDELLELTQLAKSLGVKLEQVTIRCENSTKELYQSVLKECKDVADLRIFFESPLQLQVDLDQAGPFSCDSVFISGPLSLTQFMNNFRNCNYISIFDYPSQDLNLILKSWVAGELRATYFTCYTSDDLNEAEVMNGIPNSLLENEPSKQIFLVKNIDGVEAVVQIHDCKLILNTRFSDNSNFPIQPDDSFDRRRLDRFGDKRDYVREFGKGLRQDDCYNDSDDEDFFEEVRHDEDEDKSGAPSYTVRNYYDSDNSDDFDCFYDSD